MVAKRKSENSAERSSDKENVKKSRKDSSVIFVGQLPFKATRQELQELFEGCGNLRSVRMGRKTIRAKNGQVTHLFNGSAHVEFESIEAADKALQKLSGMKYKGRTLRADKASPQPIKSNEAAVRAPTAEPSNTLFVANLPYNYELKELEAVFLRQRGFVSARAQETHASRGFAYVQFKTVQDAESAVRALNGANFHGRAMRFDFANSRQTANVKSNAAETLDFAKTPKPKSQKKASLPTKQQALDSEEDSSASDESEDDDDTSDQEETGDSSASDKSEDDDEASDQEEAEGPGSNKSDESSSDGSQDSSESEDEDD